MSSLLEGDEQLDGNWQRSRLSAPAAGSFALHAALAVAIVISSIDAISRKLLGQPLRDGAIPEKLVSSALAAALPPSTLNQTRCWRRRLPARRL